MNVLTNTTEHKELDIYGQKRGVGRKFIAMLICLAVIVVCAWLKIDVTMGVVSLYGLYVGSNISQKIGTSYTEHMTNRTVNNER